MFKYKWWARRIEWPDLELPEHRTLDLSFNTIPVLCVPAAASCIRVTGEQIWLCMMLTELHAMPVHSSNTYSNIIKRIGRARVSSRTRAIRRILFFLNITLVYILYKGDTFHSSIELFCSRGIAAWSWEGLHAVYSRGCNIASYVHTYISLSLSLRYSQLKIVALAPTSTILLLIFFISGMCNVHFSILIMTIIRNLNMHNQR